MSFPKVVTFLAITLFAGIGLAALVKGGKRPEQKPLSSSPVALEIRLEEEVQKASTSLATLPQQAVKDDTLPAANRIEELFTTGPMKLPFVETVSYTSRVPWLQGRPAWIVDYSTYYATSRHFIARSLNRKPDYFTQAVAEGDLFNVFRKDKEIEFYLLIDVQHCKMWLYSYDAQSKERILLKDYTVGLGRPHTSSPSGCLTPLGKYKLGPKVGIYKPGVMGTFHNQSTEMIRVFGTRWLPFEKEVQQCTAPARGYGIHGAPWVIEEKSGKLVEDRSCLGQYASDGCVRLATEDVEEIFSIIITKPTTVEIVQEFYKAQLPGKERL